MYLLRVAVAKERCRTLFLTSRDTGMLLQNTHTCDCLPVETRVAETRLALSWFSKLTGVHPLLTLSTTLTAMLAGTVTTETPRHQSDSSLTEFKRNTLKPAWLLEKKKLLKHKQCYLSWAQSCVFFLWMPLISAFCHPSHYFVLLVTLSDPYMEFIFPIRQTLNGEIKSCFPLLTPSTGPHIWQPAGLFIEETPWDSSSFCVR